MTKNDPFGGATIPRMPVAHRLLTVNGLSVGLNMPPALVSKFDGSGEEMDQGLPAYAPRVAYQVDDCENAPADWSRSDPTRKAASFFTAIKNKHGLWLDFNANNQHTHDVAAVVSIQGINSVTGQKVDDLALAKYVNGCPVHRVRFGVNRHCAACGFEWPAQNYLATTGTPGGQFWLDGFRTPEGAVRQYVFTTEPGRGVAEQLIGPNQAQALGIVFYLSKTPKPRPVYRSRGGLEGLGMAKGLESCDSMEESVQVAAGARIRQQIHEDPKPMDYWQDEPAGMLYVYYVTEAQARAVIGLPPQNREGAFGGIRTGHQNDPFQA